METIKKLYRSKTNRILFGVCGGLAEYFEIDPLIVRVLFILFVLTTQVGIIAYLVLALIIPSEESGKSNKAKKVENAYDVRLGKGDNWLLEPKNIIGLIIVLIGLDYLFGQAFRFDPFAYFNWGIVWPLLIILFGLIMIYKEK